ncbi:hypothetical protein D3C79_1016840 [compost metagenome]
MFLEVAQVAKATVRRVVCEFASKLMAAEFPGQPTILSKFIEFGVPRIEGKRADFVILTWIHA